MERDFMGLSSRDSNVDMKEEAIEVCKESELIAFSKASAGQWPLFNKVSVNPHFTAFKSAPDEKNLAGVTMKQQSVSGSRVFGSLPNFIHPSLGSVAGTTKTRFNMKPSGSPPQMTIFYGGTVNVFDDMSPEKAQAILFLAGNVSANVAQPQPQGEGVGLFSPKLLYTAPNSDRSSPISVFPHPIVQDSGSKDVVAPIKPVAVLGTPLTRKDPPKMCSSTTTIPSAVPQARKASLARFFEKRKERVMSSGPYNIGKISSEGFNSFNKR